MRGKEDPPDQAIPVVPPSPPPIAEIALPSTALQNPDFDVREKGRRLNYLPPAFTQADPGLDPSNVYDNNLFRGFMQTDNKIANDRARAVRLSFLYNPQFVTASHEISWNDTPTSLMGDAQSGLGNLFPGASTFTFQVLFRRFYDTISGRTPKGTYADWEVIQEMFGMSGVVKSDFLWGNMVWTPVDIYFGPTLKGTWWFHLHVVVNSLNVSFGLFTRDMVPIEMSANFECSTLLTQDSLNSEGIYGALPPPQDSSDGTGGGSAASKPAVTPTAPYTGKNDPVSNKALCHTMMIQRGYTETEFQNVDYIVMRESSWKVDATGSATRLGRAYGIPQSLPGSKMASSGADWKTNPATQIDWMLAYIHDRYGGPKHGPDTSDTHGTYNAKSYKAAHGTY